MDDALGRTDLLRLSDHHMAVHENARNAFEDAREYGRTCDRREHTGSDERRIYRQHEEAKVVRYRRTHGDVGYEMAGISEISSVVGHVVALGELYPSMTSGVAKTYSEHDYVKAYIRSSGKISRTSECVPICSHSAPPRIMRLHSAVS